MRKYSISTLYVTTWNPLFSIELQTTFWIPLSCPLLLVLNVVFASMVAPDNAVAGHCFRSVLPVTCLLVSEHLATCVNLNFDLPFRAARHKLPTLLPLTFVYHCWVISLKENTLCYFSFNEVVEEKIEPRNKRSSTWTELPSKTWKKKGKIGKRGGWSSRSGKTEGKKIVCFR